MSFYAPTEEERKEVARLEALRDQPIDLTDPDCPPADFVNMKWHRGLPAFLNRQKTAGIEVAREKCLEAAEK
ncbi:hypothetical protein AGMMS49957_06950 [Synergistales bacterium]|nr:hypothetical protein AGMMS49957_06950 [Synergistales bacterium]